MGHEEVHERPELHEAVLQRGTGEEEPPLGVERQERLPALALEILDVLGLVQDEVVPLVRSVSSWGVGWRGRGAFVIVDVQRWEISLFPVELTCRLLFDVRREKTTEVKLEQNPRAGGLGEDKMGPASLCDMVRFVYTNQCSQVKSSQVEGEFGAAQL